jgi:hypothetical protein
VIQAVGQLWQKAKKHSRVVLVMDTSGSMNSGGRIENARKGAAQMLRLMKDADTFSLIAFNTRINWAMRSQPLAQGRATAEKTIASLWANGGTALYDAVLAAYDDLQKSPDSGKISAVVVLTDDDERIGLELAVEVVVPFVGSKSGRLSVRGRLAFWPEETALYVREPEVISCVITGLSEELTNGLVKLAAPKLQSMFDSTQLYKFDNDFKSKRIKDIRVKDGKVKVALGI